MMTGVSPSRLNTVPVSRQRSMLVTAREFTKHHNGNQHHNRNGNQLHNHNGNQHYNQFYDLYNDSKKRSIKTAPNPRSNKLIVSYQFRRQPSTPDVRPFSEQYTCKKGKKRPHKRGPTTRVPNKDPVHYKDRSYMPDLYSWAKAREERSDESIKGLELAEGILKYKVHRPQSSYLDIHCENEDPFRSGLGYQGYMDCLLRGRKTYVSRKDVPLTTSTDVEESNNDQPALEPTLVPSNSLVKD